MVQGICDALEEILPAEGNPLLKARGVSAYRQLITFVQDRPGHDFRYAIDPSRIEGRIGWKATRDFDASLRDTVRWYCENKEWCMRVTAGVYGGERLGSGSEQGHMKREKER
jgi:dTDP-glucose 4,6-dehydratase